jgi:hypothetical protein
VKGVTVKRQYSLKQLAILKDTTEDYRDRVRMLLRVHQAELQRLNSPSEKKKYQASYHLNLLVQAKQNALDHMRFLGQELLGMLRPAMEERGLHSREYHLQEAGYRDVAPNLADKEKAATLQAMADLSAGIKQLTWQRRLERMDNDGIAAMAEHAVRVGDIGLAGLALEEAGLRKDGLLNLRVKSAVDKLDVPEATQAEEVFAFMEETLLELANTERLIQNPNNMEATSYFGSRRIRAEQQARQAAEQEEREKAEKEKAKQEHEDKTAAVEEYLAKDQAA